LNSKKVSPALPIFRTLTCWCQMKKFKLTSLTKLALFFAGFYALAGYCGSKILAQAEIRGTAPWRLGSVDPAALMVQQIGADLDRRIKEAPSKRNYATQDGPNSLSIKKQRLSEILGVVDSRVGIGGYEVILADGVRPTEAVGFVISSVRWPVLPRLDGEGLLLEPKTPNGQTTIVLGDADDLPEALIGLIPGTEKKAKKIRALAQSGSRVFVVAMVDRRDDNSGSRVIGRFTNQPHREFVYRMAYEMGRHVIGYEIQRVLGLVDILTHQDPKQTISLWGWGEGGVVALPAAALDERISRVGLGGSFSPKENVWQEPIYRNVWNYVSEFGDAGTAVLLGNRALFVSNEACPIIEGPPTNRNGRTGAAPGKLGAYDLKKVEAEFDLARQKRIVGQKNAGWLLASTDDEVWERMFGQLPHIKSVPMVKDPLDIQAKSLRRHDRLMDQLCDHVQLLWQRGDRTRMGIFHGNALAQSGKWDQETPKIRKVFHDQVIGNLGQTSQVPSKPAHSRKIYDTPEFTGWEVEMDLPVAPGVFAQGIYLVPKGIKEGEKRPVIVCQHGLEGKPQDVANPLKMTTYYNSFAAQLAERGYIVFAPQNPYIGHDRFRVLQRKANPIGLSLFSYITAQHRVILDWLKTRPEVDPERLAFYGLSYGGKTAMRVPAILTDYCLSICSGDFNEWVGKNVSREPWGQYVSYMYTGEYEMPEFNLGSTFNYAEMGWLIAPRPFMVERGHDDGVGIDSMVSSEYAKIREVYARLKIPHKTEIEFFLGGHEIQGKGTFEFLKKHLNYPK